MSIRYLDDLVNRTRRGVAEVDKPSILFSSEQGGDVKVFFTCKDSVAIFDVVIDRIAYFCTRPAAAGATTSAAARIMATTISFVILFILYLHCDDMRECEREVLDRRRIRVHHALYSELRNMSQYLWNT
jgi:hypothetical protein